MIVVFVGSAVATPRSSGSNASFCSRQQARLKAALIRSPEEVLKRTRSPAPQAPLRNTEKSEIWPHYLIQDADEHYKGSDVTDILNKGAHAMKVDVP